MVIYNAMFFGRLLPNNTISGQDKNKKYFCYLTAYFNRATTAS